MKGITNINDLNDYAEQTMQRQIDEGLARIMVENVLNDTNYIGIVYSPTQWKEIRELTGEL